MIKFNSERRTAVLYTCATCNLNCRYCTIDKNPVLKDIDDELEKSFEGDYYFKRIKEYFPRKDMLCRVETWGGEPFLKMHRIYPLIHQLIEYYPYCNEFFSSTNFSYDEWIDEFMGLMNCFRKHEYRQFYYTLQLSVDGPEYINDANRGVGVTKRCIANFDKLVKLIKEGQFRDNVSLEIYLKGTWDLNCIHYLNDKQKLIEFFQFYENEFVEKIKQLNNPNISFDCAIPNTAVPAPVTKHDGEIFAELVKKCTEIEEENLVYHYFKYYRRITPFSSRCMCPNYFYGTCNQCGSGKSLVGFLPHNMVSACHEGFTLLAENYKIYAAKRSEDNLSVSLNHFLTDYPTPMCLTDDQYALHEFKMQYLNENSNIQLATAVTDIIALALAKQIDSQFLLEENALIAARYIIENTAYCIKNNYSITGSFATDPLDLYKLILNGALQYLIQGGEMNGSYC